MQNHRRNGKKPRREFVKPVRGHPGDRDHCYGRPGRNRLEDRLSRTGMTAPLRRQLPTRRELLSSDLGRGSTMNSNTPGRLSVICAVTFALFGCSGDRPSSPTKTVETAKADEGEGGASAQAAAPKVTICHIPPGNPSNAHTITIAAPAVPAHVANHGDTLGPCPQPSPIPTPTPTPAG